MKKWRNKMARIYEEELNIVMSKLVKNANEGESIQKPLLTDEQKETLLSALEQLIDNPSIIIEYK
jgi:hypothetical protein